MQMNSVANLLNKLGILKQDSDYHFIRASMVVIFLFFGYQKWFDYEAQALIPFISHGPLIFWMYSFFGLKGATWFLGVAEWFFGTLLFAGFWNKKLGILGALGSCVAFLLKDLVLLAASVYLLRQDVLRVSLSAKESPQAASAQLERT